MRRNSACRLILKRTVNYLAIPCVERGYASQHIVNAQGRKNLGRNQSYYEENAEGFSMHLDLDKIRNYDKDRIVQSLEQIVDRIKDKII